MAEPSSSWWALLYGPNSAKQADDPPKGTICPTLPPANPVSETSSLKHSSQARYKSTELRRKPETKSPKPKVVVTADEDGNKSVNHEGDLNPAQNTSLLFGLNFLREYFSHSERNLDGLNKDNVNLIQGVEVNETSDSGCDTLQSSWWWSSSQNAAYENTTGVNETYPSKGAPNVNEGELSWFSWLWYRPENSNDAEQDPLEQHRKRLFSEAQSAIESPRGSSCSYAIYNIFGEGKCALAVEGTKSEEYPVDFDIDKKPILPNESFEMGLSYTKSYQDVKPVKLASALQLGETQAQPKVKSSRLSDSQAHTSKAGSCNNNSSEIIQDSSVNKCEFTANGLQDFTEVLNACDSQTREQLDITSGKIPLLPQLPVLPILDRNLRNVTFITKARLWGEAFIYGEKTSEKHIYKSTHQSIAHKRDTLAKRVVIISTHSFLPIKFVKSFIGQGTGNAFEFASWGAEATLKWKKNTQRDLLPGDILNGLGERGCIIHTISLEGIGTIKDRVETSWKLLRNWSAEIRSADSVLFLSNSIACPVNAFLLEKMHKHNAEFKVKDKKVGVLNMAGISSGIFPGIDSKTVRRAYTADENNILREVFDLQSEKSAISREISHCLERLCSMNVKFTYCGAVDDQFVPMYSACANKIKHPNMFKCLYARSGSDVPAFVTCLIEIILTLENVGHYDETLLNELLNLVQGPNTQCGSHGYIFKCPEVYDMAIRFAFETTSLKRQKLPRTTENQQVGTTPQNLYNLPWMVRGLVHDLMYTKNVHSRSLIQDLIVEYRRWKPVSRQWKEVKNSFAAFEEVSIDDILV